MSSSWDPAIPQAMQRHGGRNWSLPKVIRKPPQNKAPNEPAAIKTPMPENADTVVTEESPGG